MKGRKLLTVVFLSILAVTGFLAGSSVLAQSNSTTTIADGGDPVPPQPWS